MLDLCQPIQVNNLYGSLKINTNDSLSCMNPRKWYFFYDYGYALFIRIINITQLLSNSFVFKIYSTTNKQNTLVYDSTNATIVNNEIQIDLNDKNSGGILVELMSSNHRNIEKTTFIIDYAFRVKSESRFGRQTLQDNSSSSSFNSSQPTFIALMCVIIFLLICIVVVITIMCYRHYSRKNVSKRRQRIENKFRNVLNYQQASDQAHLASSITPSSASSYSLPSSRHLCPNNRPISIQQKQQHQQNSSLGQSISTLPSMIPSRRLQQSIMDAYLNDFDTVQPATADSKQLNSYLFIDLHSTSSETFPDAVAKQYPNDNTTTSGYDTSTCGEDRNYKSSFQNRRRRRLRYYYNQRQRRRSTMGLKRPNGPRFLMRERSLPNALSKLPQLRQHSHLFDMRDPNSSSTTSNTNQDHISTNFSITTDDYDDSHAYHVNSARIMNTIEEEKPSVIHQSLSRQPYLFEMVSTYCGDDSDMPNYEHMPRPLKSSSLTGDGIAYVNDSIIV
ncbi:unnamed protein product [Rotaria socialis]|uniref:Uncharacterized protein n=1 Tax=Rotaria socialis TaxID=392032 RepID=A0A818GZ12_9BILA|nr:unnamed protein product [Rotaria socialis]CAF4720372.1 unnamed protein product [Rotaria socialis]